MGDLTLKELQHRVNEWIHKFGVKYFSPLTNMAILTEEVGEVARIMSRLYGEQSLKPGEQINKEALADELADVLWVVTCIANQTQCDLTTAIEKNIAKKSSRDAQRHLNNPKLKS